MARTSEQVAASSEELTASAHQSADAAVRVAETVGEVSQNPLADSGMLPFLYLFLRLVNLDRAGQRIGRHRGDVRYTIGQRKGLRLAAAQPLYVCGKDMEANTVTVGTAVDLYARELYATDLNWIALPELSGPLLVLVY